MVSLKDGDDLLPSQVPDQVNQVLANQGVEPLLVYTHVNKGFVAEMTEQRARLLERMPQVRAVERD
ncbi:protease inhibitor I9 family protein [Natronospira bacteriovora]|uniref:protease inhibitor I9 family protein n=1 Tax=Natronospira bacteriovora TaxID=3069753 RepID=UPI0035B56708